MSDIIITKTGRYKLVKIEEPESSIEKPAAPKNPQPKTQNNPIAIVIIIAFGVGILFLAKFLESM